MRKALFILIPAVLVLDIWFVVLMNRRAAPPPDPAAGQAPTANATPSPKPELPAGDGILRGFVRDAFGNPVAAASVEAFPRNLDAAYIGVETPAQSPSWTAVSDAAGVYEIRYLPEGAYVVRAASKGRVALAAARVSPGGAAAEVDLAVSAARSVRGRVVAPDGKPLPNARVYLAGIGEPPRAASLQLLLPAAADAEGKFAIEHMPAETVRLVAAHPDFALTLSDAIPAAQSEMELRMDAGIAVSGQLVNAADGNPAAGATVIVREHGLGVEQMRATADYAGIFRFRGLRPGHYVLRLDSDRSQLAEAPAAEFDVAPYAMDALPQGPPAPLGPWRIVPAAILHGRVMDTVKDRSVEEVAIAIEGTGLSTRTDGSGFYLIGPLNIGAYIVGMTRPRDYAPLKDIKIEAAVTRTGQVEVPQFEVARGATLWGRVLDAAGAPVGEANVFVSFGGDAIAGRDVRTAQNGTFQIGGLWREAGLRLWAEKLGRSGAGVGPIAIGEEDVRGITLGIAARNDASIAGRVVRANGAGAGGARVTCAGEDVSLRVPREAVADAEGFYTFERLLPGTYALAARGEARTAAPLQLKLQEAEHATGVRLTLD